MATWMIVWGVAILVYGLFWVWYVGFGRKISEDELKRYMVFIEQSGLSEESLASYRNFFANDDGKEFFMANLLHLKSPKRESRQLLAKYSSVFVGKLMKKAGHPYFFGLAQARNLENLNCEVVDGVDNSCADALPKPQRSWRDAGEYCWDRTSRVQASRSRKNLCFPRDGES